MSTNVEKYPIREDWEEYYKFLEAVRRTGACNMWGANIYLVEAFHMSNKESQEILVNWIENYDALNQTFGWQ